MRGISSSLLYLGIILRLPSMTCQTSENGWSEPSPKKFSELDWDKFDHLYDIGQTRPDVRSTPPPELSKEAHLALSMLDHNNDSPTTKGKTVETLTIGKMKYRQFKAREQKKLETMSKPERDAYFDQKKAKYREDSRKRRAKIGHRIQGAQSYSKLKKLVDTNSATSEQVEKLKKIKENNRNARRRWRVAQKERIKQVRTYKKEGTLTPEQAEELGKYEKNLEKMRKSSQRARDRKKALKTQAKERNDA
ncbi:uncharacterized protein FA14DRAFT_175990 [Meira miltonrushii]|uniref:Ribosomal RNA-processing protein 14/surfeit locus protein 6 C-terminal domain-containing protein n=1 Tax=Meira miltonrushii TaxID=1280837 RepID=A0A316VM88_9BASI|nr:uncharacterized protein FA14DRAFT_175990 [Meira miltonrushii]PWN36685.1 hypothetical protein FA14DRAFT_175990 [Meira miltonrushii]